MEPIDIGTFSSLGSRTEGEADRFAGSETEAAERVARNREVFRHQAGEWREGEGMEQGYSRGREREWSRDTPEGGGGNGAGILQREGEGMEQGYSRGRGGNGAGILQREGEGIEQGYSRGRGRE